MSESTMWGRVRKALKGLDPVRIENKLEKGVPDVNYVEGWIELKWCRRAPRKGGVLVVDHYSQEQRTWALRRKEAGGRIFMFLKVSEDWILMDGAVAAEYLCYVPLDRLKEVAIKVWKKQLIDSELRQLLN